MLVLVAGATGNVGQHIIESLVTRGHQARALARTPSKFSASVHAKLESFVQAKSYYDIDVLDRACASVDAVVCAYSGIPELSVEAQLILLRAAERVGIKRFVASTWNYDWTKISLGMQESYDPLILFHNHVELSSDIRPIYIFSGVLAEVLFAFHGQWTAQNHGVWDPEEKKFKIYGTGNELWHYTTEKDAAEFAVEIIQRDDAAQGGFWNVCSGVSTLKQMATIYEEVRGVKADVEILGTVTEMREKALEARKRGSKRAFWEYIGWFYQLYTADGTWTLGELDNGKLGVKETPLTDFLRNNPTI